MLFKLAAGLAVLTVALTTGTAMAGTQEDPEIADPAGDANIVSALSDGPGDTRPASLDNADLRAVWFDTEHTVIDGEPRPAALRIHFQTEGAVRSGPLANRQFWYEVTAVLPACTVTFRLTATPDPAGDTATLWAPDGCPGIAAGSGVNSPVAPAVSGATATMTFPLNFQQLPQIIPAGATLSSPVAQVRTPGVSVVVPTLDTTAPGRAYTIG